MWIWGYRFRYHSEMSLASGLVETARIRADLTQAELAERAETSQPAIALYEAGRRSPSLETLERILRAAGYEMRIRLEPIDDHDEVLERWLATVPIRERRRFAREQRQRIGR